MGVVAKVEIVQILEVVKVLNLTDQNVVKKSVHWGVTSKYILIDIL